MIRVKPAENCNGPATNAKVEHEQRVLAFFRPVLFSMRVAGINCGSQTIVRDKHDSCVHFEFRNLSKFTYWMLNVFVTLAIAITVSVSVWFLYTTTTHEFLSPSWTVSFFIFIIHIIPSIMASLGSLHFWNGRFNHWIRQFVKYELTYGMKVNKGRLFTKRWYFYIVYTLMVATTPASLAHAMLGPGIIKRQISLFNESLDWVNMALVYVDITIIYLFLQVVIFVPVPGTYMLGIELEVVRDKFKSYVGKHGNKTYSESLSNGHDASSDVTHLSEVIKQHEDICSLVSEFNECINYILFTLFLLSLPASCFSFYVLMMVSASPGTILLPTMLLSYSLVPSAILCVIGAMLNSKAHAPMQYLWQIPTAALSELNMRDLLMFTTKLTNTSIGYSVYGFFTLSLPTVLTIVGTVITYLVVVVQFRSPAGQLTMNDDLISNLTRFLQTAEG